MAIGSKLRTGCPVVAACDCGNVKLVRDHYRLIRGGTRSCGCLLTEVRRAMGLANLKSEIDSDYMRSHRLIRAIKGKASEYRCIGCGNPAHQWSYEGGDPDERTEMRADGRPGIKPRLVKFSFSPKRYIARCRSCHIRHDVMGKRHAEELLWLL
jgi:hypothetical protein